MLTDEMDEEAVGIELWKWAFNHKRYYMGRWGKVSVHTLSNIFQKILTEGTLN